MKTLYFYGTIFQIPTGYSSPTNVAIEATDLEQAKERITKIYGPENGDQRWFGVRNTLYAAAQKQDDSVAGALQPTGTNDPDILARYIKYPIA